MGGGGGGGGNCHQYCHYQNNQRAKVKKKKSFFFYNSNQPWGTSFEKETQSFITSGHSLDGLTPCGRASSRILGMLISMQLRCIQS